MWWQWLFLCEKQHGGKKPPPGEQYTKIKKDKTAELVNKKIVRNWKSLLSTKEHCGKLSNYYSRRNPKSPENSNPKSPGTLGSKQQKKVPIGVETMTMAQSMNETEKKLWSSVNTVTNQKDCSWSTATPERLCGLERSIQVYDTTVLTLQICRYIILYSWPSI